MKSISTNRESPLTFGDLCSAIGSGLIPVRLRGDDYTVAEHDVQSLIQRQRLARILAQADRARIAG